MYVQCFERLLQKYRYLTCVYTRFSTFRRAAAAVFSCDVQRLSYNRCTVDGPFKRAVRVTFDVLRARRRDNYPIVYNAVAVVRVVSIVRNVQFSNYLLFIYTLFVERVRPSRRARNFRRDIIIFSQRPVYLPHNSIYHSLRDARAHTQMRFPVL